MRAHVGLSILAVVLALVAAPTATAHQTRTFEACTVNVPGTCISRGAAFLYGDTVVVRGKVRPAHAGSLVRVLRRDPGSDRWTRVGEVEVSETGGMRFRWTTTYDDAVQDEPYLFRFRLPEHGHSNRTEAWVLFGE